MHNLMMAAQTYAMMAMGFPEFIVDGYIKLNVDFSQNFANTTTDNIKIPSGKAPRSISDFVSDFKSFFADAA